MLCTPAEFAHSLRSMRPSYKATVKYVHTQIAHLTERNVAGSHKQAMQNYQGALEALLENPKIYR